MARQSRDGGIVYAIKSTEGGRNRYAMKSDKSDEILLRRVVTKRGGCLIKNSTKSINKDEKCSKKYNLSEFLMRTEPRGELI